MNERPGWTAVPPRAVLLDMGGVLVDMGNEAGLPRGEADREGREAMLSLLRRRGRGVSDDDLERLLFAPWRAEYEQRYRLQREADWGPHLARLIGVAGAEIAGDELLAAWFAPYGERLSPVAAARDVLAALRALGLGLALVSNVALPGTLYRQRLASWGLATPFAAMRFSYDAGSRKPSPRMLEEALAALGQPAQAGVMVGDRRGSDVAAGRAAGTRTVWLRSAQGEGPEPDLTIEALADLPRALGRWLPASHPSGLSASD